MAQRRATAIALAAGLIALLSGGSAAAERPDYEPGARSAGDPLFPQIGNGGYDARRYRIELDYDPATNTFRPGTRTTMIARATQNLSSFSLDFQDFDVSSVRVNGRPAAFRETGTTPTLGDPDATTQPRKLVVDPRRGIPKRARFRVTVAYSGEPREITDADGSIEGWIRACYPLAEPRTCDGSFVVNEPIGAQSWFPSNNHPTDKARFDTVITVPVTHTAFGIGELVHEPLTNGDGTWTWSWREDDPSATYLTTGTVGLFDESRGAMREALTGRKLLIYNAIDSSATPAQRTAINASVARQPGMVDFFGELFGPYPFDSIGAIADRAAGVGYALEVQTKSHFAGGFSSGNPSVNVGTLAHEVAHQWMGNSVSPATWHEIWFNEGWAEWSQWYWSFAENGGPDPAAIFDELYAETPPEDWEMAPAVLDNDPANLFAGFPVYDRPAMMLQGYREIVGDARFERLARLLLARYGYGNVSLEQFVATALEASGLAGARRARLADYFDQWLFGTERPELTPEDF